MPLPPQSLQYLRSRPCSHFFFPMPTFVHEVRRRDALVQISTTRALTEVEEQPTQRASLFRSRRVSPTPLSFSLSMPSTVAAARVELLFVVSLATVASTAGAVIAVTAGGAVTEPTYMFSDSNGDSVATLTGNVSNGDITASGDLKTGAGNGLNNVASRLATLEAGSYPTYVGATLKTATGSYGCSSLQKVSWTTYELNSPHVSTSQLSTGTFKPNVAGYYSCSAALYKTMRYEEIFDLHLYKNGATVRKGRMYRELQAVGPTHNPARAYIVNTVTAVIYLDGVSDSVETYNQVINLSSCADQLDGGTFASWHNQMSHMTCHLVGV